MAGELRMGVCMRWTDEPPAAVARRDPSGETWQLYTSNSLRSPGCNRTGQRWVFGLVSQMLELQVRADVPGWFNHSGFTRCIVASLRRTVCACYEATMERGGGRKREGRGAGSVSFVQSRRALDATAALGG